MTDAYEGLPFPRTGLAEKALRYARDTESPAVFNHSMRTYLYGRLLGEGRGLRPDHDYDDELLFLGCVLHDTGLGTDGGGDGPFNLDGADLAARFLAGEGMADDRVEVVWDAVALHFHHDIAVRKRPEIALVSIGAGYDLGIIPSAPPPPEYAERVDALLPRLHAAAVLHDTIVGQALDEPGKAPPFTLPGELFRQHTGASWPTWKQLVGNSKTWNDYDGYEPAH